MTSAILSDDLYKYPGFKLISLELQGNDLLGSVKYNFVNDANKFDRIYRTILIGPNGTGKSNLFRIIVELFKEVYDQSIGKQRSYKVAGNYTLRFSLGGSIFQYTNIFKVGDIDGKSVQTTEKPYLLLNDLRIDFQEVQLPIALVVNSIMITDKFPFYRSEDFPSYKYLGIKGNAQSASTRSFVRRTIERIVEQIDSMAFRNGLAMIAGFLEISNAININYYTAYTSKFFRGNLTKEVITEYFTNIEAKYSASPTNAPFKLTRYQKIRDNQELLQELCNFCNSLVTQSRLKNFPNSSTKGLSYNIIDERSFQNLKSEYRFLEELRLLGLIHPPEISFQRERNYSLDESSSGEYQFFSAMIGLMASVKTNSLILIDEPEISLHPNWQMKYLSFVEKLFSNEEYSTSHIIIATHSHFLISDLTLENASLIGLSRVGNNVVPDSLSPDTFGWSAEQILLEVFKVPTTRNYFIADKVGEILELVSKKDRDESLIKQKVLSLIKLNILNLSQEDPLSPVIKRLVEKYG